MKRLFYLVVMLVVIVVAAGLIAPFIVPKNEFKNLLGEKIEQLTGKKMTIAGKFDIHFLPTVGMYVEKVSLTDKDTGKPFVTLKSLSVDAKLMPLFNGQLVINGITLDSPQVILVKDEKGGNNWSFPTAVSAPPVVKSPAPEVIADARHADEPAPEPKTPDTLQNLQLKHFDLKNGTISFEDRSNGTAVSIQHLSVSTSGMHEAIAIKGDTQWNKQSVQFDAQVKNLSNIISHGGLDIAARAVSDLVVVTFTGGSDWNQLNGSIHVKAPSVTAAQAWLQPNAAPLSATLSDKLLLDIESKMELSPLAFNLTDVQCNLGELLADGSIKIAFVNKVPDVNIQLSTQEFDINKLLPHAAKHASLSLVSNAFADTTKTWSDAPLNLSFLRAFNGKLLLNAKAIHVGNVSIGETIVQAGVRDGLLSTTVFSDKAYGGTLQTNVTMNAKTDIPIIQQSIAVTNMRAEKMLRDLANMRALSGALTMQSSLSSQGKSVRDLVSALQGSGRFAINNGALQDTNLINIIQTVQAVLNPENTRDGKLTFSDFSGSFTVKKGNVNNSDLSIKSDALQISGAGTVDLPNQAIHYRLTPAAGKKGNVQVPIIVEGPLSDPSYSADAQAAVQNVVKNSKQLNNLLSKGTQLLKGLSKQPSN